MQIGQVGREAHTYFADGAFAVPQSFNQLKANLTNDNVHRRGADPQWNTPLVEKLAYRKDSWNSTTEVYSTQAPWLDSLLDVMLSLDSKTVLYDSRNTFKDYFPTYRTIHRVYSKEILLSWELLLNKCFSYRREKSTGSKTVTVVHSTRLWHQTAKVTQPPDFAPFFVEFQLSLR